MFVYSILEELQAMQKEKTERKKHKQMSKAATLAKAQITDYLDSWDSRVHATTQEVTGEITRKFDEIIESYKLPVFLPFETEMQLLLTDSDAINESLQLLPSEMTVFQSEVQKTVKSLKDTESSFKQELNLIKKNVMEQYRNEVLQRDGNTSSSGHNTHTHGKRIKQTHTMR